MKNKNLGKIATDKVTGFQGVVMGCAEYLTGCTQYCVLPQADGVITPTKYPEDRWLDEGRLIFKKEVVFTPASLASDDNGCDVSQPHSS